MKKSTCVVFLIGLFLFVNSCQDGVIKSETDLALKSGAIKKSAVIDDVKSWIESNPDENNFFLLEYSNPINWENSRVTEVDNSIAFEVKLKLKSKYKLMIEKTPALNFDQRLLFIKENGNITSYMELFISKRDTAYLQDFDNANYQKKDGSFEGTILLLDSGNDIKQIYQSEEDCQEVKLKSVDETCYELVEIFSDGSTTVIANFGCSGGGGDGSSSSPSGSAGRPTVPAPVPIVDATDLQKNALTNCIYNKLQTSDLLKNIVSAFVGSTQYSITYTIVDNLLDTKGEQAYGSCRDNGDGTMTVKVNSYYFGKIAPVSIAKTILHESIHANIYQEVASIGGLDNLSTDNFERLFAYYMTYGTDFHHPYIAGNYVPEMAKALQSFDGNRYSYDYYEALSWAGLYETYEWQTKTQTEKDEIERKINEINGGNKNCN